MVSQRDTLTLSVNLAKTLKQTEIWKGFSQIHFYYKRETCKHMPRLRDIHKHVL